MFKTNPYLMAGLLSKPWVSYQVDQERKLRVASYFHGDQTLSLESVSTSVDHGKGILGLIRKSLDIGDVTIAVAGGEITCSKVRCVTEFLSAIDGHHEHVKVRDPWQNSATLSNKIFCIPAIPTSLYEVLRSMQTTAGTSFLEWKVKKGDYVEKGDVLAEFRVQSFRAHCTQQGRIMTSARVIAPVYGKIAFLGTETTDVAFDDGSSEMDDSMASQEDAFIFGIQPAETTRELPASKTETYRVSSSFGDVIRYLHFCHHQRRCTFTDMSPDSFANTKVVERSLGDQIPD